MKLFVVRHGEAEAPVQSDFERQLTARGQQDVKAVAQQLQVDLAQASHLWVSPYTRTQQTAAIIQQVLPAVTCITSELLTPEANPLRLCEAIEDAQLESLILVSHQPLVGRLVDDLCGLEPGRYFMGPGSVACMETELLAADMAHLLYLQTAQGAIL